MRLSRVLPTLMMAAALVVGCTMATPEPRPLPALSYQKYPPIRINVARIQVVDKYAPSGQMPHIETQMALPLPDAVHQWAQRRFQAMGQDGVLTITIDNAAMLAEDLNRSKGVRGVFTIDQAQRFSGAIHVSFSASDMSFGRSGNAQVEVKSSRTVAEDASLQQQDVVLANLTESLLTELDAATLRVWAEKLPSLMQQGGVQQ